MSIPTTSWDEASPAGSDNIALGDNRIREMKTQIREVIDVDHDFPSSGSAADVGQHKQVTLQEQADLGTGAEGVPILGAQTVGGKAELLFTDEDDNDIQVTSAGKIKLSSGRLENNTNLTARNAAGSGDVNLLKANASDQAEVTPALLASGGAILPEISAPTTAANQGALYTKNDGTQTELYFREESNGDEVKITNGGALNIPPGFGDWVNKTSSYAAQQAATDGFIVLATGELANNTYSVYTDSASNPTTLRGYGTITNGAGTQTITVPVKKNDYWKVVLGGSNPTITALNWIPLGT